MIHFRHLPLEWLQPGRYQPRQQFDTVALEELAASIRLHGLIEPLIVRPIMTERYEIIAGERRWRAAMLLGLTEVPCLVGHYQDEQAAAVTLIENIQREDLNLIEEAQGYQRLITEFHFQQDDIAQLVGKSRSHIANILRLLTLCDPVQTALCQRQLSLGHARMLVGLPQAIQQDLLAKIRQQQWSVRQLEEAVRQMKTASSTPFEPSYELNRLQTQLAEQLGAPVQIVNENQSSGWLKIKFFDNDTLAGLLERLGLRYD